MKRSEVLRNKAIDAGMMAAAIFACSVCAIVWSVRAGLSEASGGALALAAALAGLRIAWWWGGEARRYARLAAEEAAWEWRREVRPRL